MLGVPLFLQLALLPLLVRTAHQDSGIVNGKEAQPHSRPYMVSVQQKNRHACGGFLVSDSFVMTAAHCLKWGENLTVLLGAHDISENRKSNRAEVKFYHIHPGFDAHTLENDIMLLQLRTAVRKSKEVKWIPLPKKDKDTKPKTLCSVAGWGAIKTNGTSSPRLLEVNVNVMDRAVCRKIWRNKPITPRMMCAGGGADNRGFCQGDSGGPLVCKDTAVGIVTFNDGNCDTPKRPNVYTQISKYLPWVKCIISSIK
ncbi:mast cell protease 1A-like [Anguilla anguilla]|uniref:mast cell protease 1A-like n=1 Tax=Anguilla anguilla TaxID=7936 RepID=UPI0015A8B9DD|nr:mast cell protease 1A-like [Anguilla anguilla]